MNKDKDPCSTNNTLEFLLNTLCRAFNSDPISAAQLITNYNKNLVDACVLGVNNKFNPAVNWYKDILLNSQYLCRLLKLEQTQAEKDKRVEANNENFVKILLILASGCQSLKMNVAVNSLKALRSVAHDL